MRPIFVYALFIWLHHTAVKAQVHIPGIPFPARWEHTPEQFEMTPLGFRITSGHKTDLFCDPNAGYNTDNAPQLLFEPDQDFVLTASIQHRFQHQWDGGALLLKADSAHWIKFCFEKDYTGARRVVSVVTRDVSDDCNSVEISSNRVFFKIAKTGSVITLYCATDPKQWLLVRHLQFNASVPLRVGFMAQSPEGKSCTVTFENIHYVSRRISDPYKGE